MNEQTEQPKPQNPMVAFRHEAEKMGDQIRAALPAHIPVERFQRVLMTAIQSNPKLLMVERRSLWNSAIKCAQDGLLPDGREAAIVEYRDRDRGEIAQYLPMIAGIRKKVRNSGEIATWDVHAVYEKDEFDYELGDNPFIRHKPAMGDRGKIAAVYSVATLKSGEKSRDVMTIFEVEKIRAISRAKNGPWANPTFYPEMAKKTVARRHAKVLPMSTDLDDLIRRDDNLYDLDAASDKAVKGSAGRVSLTDALDRLAAGPGSGMAISDQTGTEMETIDAETGEVVEAQAEAPAEEAKAEPEPAKAKGAKATKAQDQRGATPDQMEAEARVATKAEPTIAADFAAEVAAEAGGDDDFPGDAPREQTPADVAYDRGFEARKAGRSRKAVPGEYRESDALANSWLDGFEAADAQITGGAK
jgi:recombination protein RecT